MKEATGTTTTMKMAFAFTLLFVGFLTIAIIYNRAFKVKNEALSIIEKYEGISNTSLKIMNNYLKNSGYNTKGTCSEEEYGVPSLEKEDYEIASKDTKYYYCLSYRCPNGCKNQIYYKFKLFFKFNLPFLGDLVTYNITGETKAIKYYTNNQKLK